MQPFSGRRNSFIFHEYIDKKGREIIFTRYLQLEDVDSFIQLDQKVYKNAYQVDKETTLARLRRNPYTDITILNDKKELMGYISLCPVPKEMFNQIKSLNVSETQIEEETQAYSSPGLYYAYLSSIVIDKERFPQFSGKWLFQALENHLISLRKRGVMVSYIVAVAVSIAGKKTLERYGFTETQTPNVFVYICRTHLPSFFSLSTFCALFSLLDSLKGNHWVSV